MTKKYKLYGISSGKPLSKQVAKQKERGKNKFKNLGGENLISSIANYIL